MTQDERIALISFPIVILIGVGFAIAGSVGVTKVLGLPLFALSHQLKYLMT